MAERCPTAPGVGWRALLCALVMWLCALDAAAQVSIAGLTYPVYYAQDELQRGQTNLLKMRLVGESVDIRSDGTWLVKQMRLEHYDPVGRTNLTANAPECVLHPVQKTASSHTQLALQAENGVLFLQGNGFFCNLTNMTLALSNAVETKIREDAARTARARKPSAGSLAQSSPATNAPAGTNYITIASDRMLFDYPSNTVTYTSGVRVGTTQFEMACERLDGKRATNGALENIIAQENVVLFNKADQSSAFGDRAVYLVQDGRETLLLSGSRARWQDQLREAMARQFSFDLKEQRLEAVGEAYFKLPRSSLGQESILPARQSPRDETPGDLEINAEFVSAQLPTTNNPHRSVIARTNVVIVSAADKNRATGDEARYSESTGILELNGNAFWQTGERIISGRSLFADRTNRVFAVSENTFLRLPLADLGKQSLLSPFLAERTNSPAVSNAPQFLEMWCNNVDYRSDALTFRERVRGVFLEGTNALGSLNCGFLSLRFNSNQVENVTARDAVHIEQFPYVSSNGTTISKSVDCELLTALLATNGWIRRVIAETNVAAVQVERGKTNALPVASSLKAQLVVGNFFTHTNKLRELVAARQVALEHENRKGYGERAVYNVTNNTVELTGQPTADFPDTGGFSGKITEAESIIYDLGEKKFTVVKPRAQGERVSNTATNRSNLPLPK